MLVRLLVPRATLEGPQDIGDEIEVTDAEAIRMFAAEQAEPVRAIMPEKAISRRKSQKAVK